MGIQGLDKQSTKTTYAPVLAITPFKCGGITTTARKHFLMHGLPSRENIEKYILTWLSEHLAVEDAQWKIHVADDIDLTPEDLRVVRMAFQAFDWGIVVIEVTEDNSND